MARKDNRLIALTPPSSRQRGDGKIMAFSFALSIFLHGALGAAIFLAPKPPAVQVFILVDSGEEAVEMEIGSHQESSPAVASAPSPPPEQRFEPENFEEPLERPETPELEEELAMAPAVFVPTALDIQPRDTRREKLEPKKTVNRRREDTPPEPESPPITEPAPKVETESEAASAAPESQASEASRIGGIRNIVRGVRQRARPQGAFQLVYPHLSRQRGESGAVLIAASVGPDGRCLSARVERSSGYPTLDQAALDTVMRAPFQPATMDGSPITAEERFEIVFELQ